MKKILGILVLAMAAQVAMAGAYPRKFLIEHFTGEGCGYCPGGMMAMREVVEDEPGQYVWISNHAGFSSDEYTITPNNTYVQWYGVQGAPSMVLNRTKRMVDGTNSLNFHPGWLPDLTINDARTSDVEVKIQNDYNPETRELTVTVSGGVADADITSLRVTVWLKENGLVGKQSDYQYCFSQSWAKYLHPCVMRKAVSATKGDAVDVVEGKYTYTKTFTVSDAWDADNCMIVAVAHPNKATVEPIYNVDELPVVAGTTGGAEFLPEPILMTEKKPATTADVVRIEFGENQNGVLPVYFISGTSKTVGSFKAYPVVELYIKTEGNTLPEGHTYLLDDEHDDIIPGSYNEETRWTEGSILWYAERSMLDKYDYIYNLGNWLLKSVELSYADQQHAELIITTMKGYQMVLSISNDGDTPIENVEAETAIFKAIENGRVVIRRGDNVYTTSGQQIR